MMATFLALFALVFGIGDLIGVERQQVLERELLKSAQKNIVEIKFLVSDSKIVGKLLTITLAMIVVAVCIALFVTFFFVNLTKIESVFAVICCFALTAIALLPVFYNYGHAIDEARVHVIRSPEYAVLKFAYFHISMSLVAIKLNPSAMFNDSGALSLFWLLPICMFVILIWLVRLIAWFIVVCIIWTLYLPFRILNKLANLFGNASYFNVGKYVLLMIAFSMVFVQQLV